MPFGVVALFNAGGVTAVVLGVSIALVALAVLAFAYKIETSGRSLEAIMLEEGGPVSGGYASSSADTITR